MKVLSIEGQLSRYSILKIGQISAGGQHQQQETVQPKRLVSFLARHPDRHWRGADSADLDLDFKTSARSFVGNLRIHLPPGGEQYRQSLSPQQDPQIRPVGITPAIPLPRR